MVLDFAKKNRLLTAVAVIYGLLFIAVPTQATQSVSNSLYYLKEMFQVLPVIFVLTAIIEAWVPKEIIIKRLGDSSGASGAVLSLLLGSVSVGPIYAAFPISKMLIAKGASIGNIVIILSSWAVIKIPMLANEAKFLGVKFMVARWFLTVVAILIIARLVAAFVKREDMSANGVDEQHAGQLVISEPYCVGCGICVRLLPEHFEMKNTKAIVKLPVFADTVNVAELAAKCPTKAISVRGAAADN